MFSSVKGLLLLILITSFSSVSFSAGSKSSGGSKVGPSVGAMMLFGTGKMGNDTDVLSRSMVYTPVILFAGFNLKSFRMGINYEYDLVGQSDDPAKFSNQNIGGKGNSMGLRFDYYNGISSLGLIYNLSQKYTLDKPTLSGGVSEYEGKSGFGFQYYRQLKKKIGIVVDYSMGELKSSGGNSNDIKFDRIGVGLVFTNFTSSGK